MAPGSSALACMGLLSALSGCAVGPKYHRPPVETPTVYKEIAWKNAEPGDAEIRGKWWEMFGDSRLNALEEQVNVSNQNIAAAFAAFLQARALVKEARSQYFPTVSAAPNALAQGGETVATGSAGVQTGSFAQYSLPLDASWAPDLWGRIRSTVEQNVANAQVSAADLESQRLTQQADLATDYYQLRGQDRLKEILDATVRADRESLKLTQTLYKTGIDSDEAVAQAETQLESTEALDTNAGLARAQYEHAIAMLVGKPASSFSIPSLPLAGAPPRIPVGVPSRLLERRPDVAAAERGMAAANAQIGIAVAAYYPSLNLTASPGFGDNSLTGLLAVPEFLWSLGGTLSETLFDGGLRSATLEQYKATYDQSVATYRQAVLTAFQQVEDNLAGLRILERQLTEQARAVSSSARYLKISNHRYRLGIDPYLNVLSAEITLLSNQQTELGIRTQRMTTSVQLIEALGGGWESSRLPTEKVLTGK